MQFNQHVILETNKTTERIFPAVPDVESPEFFQRMDKLVELSSQVGCGGAERAAGRSSSVPRDCSGQGKRGTASSPM